MKKETKLINASEELSDLYARDLIKIFETRGEKEFRAVARYLGLSRKDITLTIKELKERGED